MPLITVDGRLRIITNTYAGSGKIDPAANWKMIPIR